MIIVTGLEVKVSSCKVCTSCYAQGPVALHEIFVSKTTGRCEICSDRSTIVRTIISYGVGGLCHQILSDIGFYRVILVDRYKEEMNAHHANRAVRP